MDTGELPHVKLGRSRRIRWEDVLRLIAESTVGAEGGTPVYVLKRGKIVDIAGQKDDREKNRG
jgi:hypothetical protein